MQENLAYVPRARVIVVVKSGQSKLLQVVEKRLTPSGLELSGVIDIHNSCKFWPERAACVVLRGDARRGQHLHRRPPSQQSLGSHSRPESRETLADLCKCFFTPLNRNLVERLRCQRNQLCSRAPLPLAGIKELITNHGIPLSCRRRLLVAVRLLVIIGAFTGDKADRLPRLLASLPGEEAVHL